MISGKTGTGKTCTMTRIILKRAILNKGLKVFGNYHIRGLKTRFEYIASPDDVDRCEEGVMSLDDFWQWLDSRCSATQRNIIFNNVMAKARKEGLDVVITTQDYWAVDRRVRINADILIKPVMIPNSTYCYVVGLDAQDYMSNMITVVHEYIYNAKKVWQWYDTKEKISSSYETDIEVRFSKISGFGDSCISWLLEKNIDRITKAVVRLWSYEKKIFLDDKSIEDIYAYVKIYSKYQTLGDKKKSVEKYNKEFDLITVGDMVD